ncbi:MAG: hypothetical protein HUJ29_10765 [Gammaproteobacteria bacterium]|nr:hypothetical protein [Gammaproteobacteria bacterium]
MTSKSSKIIFTLISCLLMGIAIGGGTNTINGLVSPEYFINILGWSPSGNVWGMSIIQGIVEGLIYGFVFAVVYTAIAASKPYSTIQNPQIIRFILNIGAVILIMWVIGGILAVVLAFINPDFYRSAIIAAPSKTGAMLRYAWVGGSIWGGMLGGLLSLVVGAVLFKNKLSG